MKEKRVVIGIFIVNLLFNYVLWLDETLYDWETLSEGEVN